jgi:putative two-component system response regulator
LILAEELRSEERFRGAIHEQFLADLQRTVPLHDIGKVAILDHILLKPSKLTPHEMSIMKKHAEIGAETLRTIIKRAPGSRFLIMAEEVAHAHHEWYDGCGYPRGLEGDNIPLAARITALADVYDAITTKRPYKDPMSHEQAVSIIRKSCGTQFDPAVVEAFLRKQRTFADIAAELADDFVAGPGDRSPDQGVRTRLMGAGSPV